VFKKSAWKMLFIVSERYCLSLPIITVPWMWAIGGVSHTNKINTRQEVTTDSCQKKYWPHNWDGNPDISDKSTNPSDTYESSCLICGDMKQVVQTSAYSLKECHPRCVYQNYSRSMIKESSQKTQLYWCVQITYQLHVSAVS